MLVILQRAWHARDPECEFVFHRGGRQLGDIRKSWYKAAIAAGLQKNDAPVGERFRFHDLRDCAVTNLIDAGINDRNVGMITGHKTTAMMTR
jgi:integrase